MLTDRDGTLLADFVGHYESLREDFDRVCRHVGIEAPLPHLNRSQHRDYRTYYDDHTRALVEEHFHSDTNLFGYTFDGRDGRAR